MCFRHPKKIHGERAPSCGHIEEVQELRLTKLKFKLHDGWKLEKNVFNIKLALYLEL